jgi:hypothetical protein
MAGYRPLPAPATDGVHLTLSHLNRLYSGPHFPLNLPSDIHHQYLFINQHFQVQLLTQNTIHMFYLFVDIKNI